MSIGNLITVSKFNAGSLASSVQNEALDQQAKAREAKADNYANQAQDSNQLAKGPNELLAVIGIDRPRHPYTSDIIDVTDFDSKAQADNFGSQKAAQEAEAGEPKTDIPFIVTLPDGSTASQLGSTNNGVWQHQGALQDVDSHNTVETRIDQPSNYYSVSGYPLAHTFVDNMNSQAGGTNVQLQDLSSKGKVGPNYLNPWCPPARTVGGDSINDGDQVASNGQKIKSTNYIDVVENIGIEGERYDQGDPKVTNLNSAAAGDNVQAQSAAQDAKTAARTLSGADARSSLFESQSNDQDVDSANAVNMRINDRLNFFQSAIAHDYNSASSASNLQDQTASQKSESVWRGAASNRAEQGQWNGQTANSGNWLNVSL
ncbi:MAG: hypothetical protein QF473_01015 [Planctomycetota bacterium]|jgi:hypothetical protein|nr:hypothetical protein [Planctomycetota bacterium]